MSWGGEGATGSLLYQDKRGQPAVIRSWPLSLAGACFLCILIRSRKIFLTKRHSPLQCPDHSQPPPHTHLGFPCHSLQWFNSFVEFLGCCCSSTGISDRVGT
jgi:hypothetical protein